jgi:S-adenosylmethionine hydrolase
MIYLFTDFGWNDLYLGQMKAVLTRSAPNTPQIDLHHGVEAFHVEAASILLDALCEKIDMRPGDVVLAVVDPGVGGERYGVVVNVRGVWLVGPDNGLFSRVTDRMGHYRCWRISEQVAEVSVSFHGRDVFAPIAASLAQGQFPEGLIELPAGLRVHSVWECCKVIYIDHYGNVMIGARAREMSGDSSVRYGNHVIPYAKVFCAAAEGALFWYENSLGLLEIAINKGSAASLLGARVGDDVQVIPAQSH